MHHAAGAHDHDDDDGGGNPFFQSASYQNYKNRDPDVEENAFRNFSHNNKHVPKGATMAGVVPPATEYVPVETVAAQMEQTAMKRTMKRKFRAIASAVAMAGGDSEAAARVAKADDTADEEIDEIIGKTRVVAPSATIQSELAAIAIPDDAMYYSSCSEDEDVLNNTLLLLNGGAPPLPHSDDEHAHVFEEDDAEPPSNRPRREATHERVRVPDDFPFAEPAAGTGSSASSAEEPMPAGMFEDPRSRRERINRLRVEVQKEWRRHGNPAPECYRCMWGNSNYDAANAEVMHELFSLLDREIGRRDFRAIAKTVHKYFKAAIYTPLVRAGKRMFMWRTRDIYAHLMKHEREPRVITNRLIDNAMRLCDVMFNETHTINAVTKQISVNEKNVRAWGDLVKILHTLMNTNPTKMINYDDNAPITLAAKRPGASTASTLSVTTAFSGHYALQAIEPPRVVNVRSK